MKYACLFSLDELRVMKMAIGFMRRSSRHRGIVFQRACRLEPELAIKIMKLEKREKKK